MRLEERARHAAGAIRHGVELMPVRAAAAAPGTYEGFLRFVERRRRNQRIATIVTALLLALLAVGGAIRMLHHASEERPADERITPQRVSDLRPSWSAPSGASTDQYSPTAGEDAVFVSTNRGQLLAYPHACEGSCEPMWRFENGRALAHPAVSDGIVYVAEASGASGARLLAFETDCAAVGPSCRPAWTGRIGHGVRWDQPPLVAGDLIVVPAVDGLYAFPIGCGRVNETCRPARMIHTPGPVLALASDQASFYVATDREVLAYAASCASDCEPTWRWPIGRPQIIASLGVAGDTLLFGTGYPSPTLGDNHLWALPTVCADHEGCAPLWSLDTEGNTFVTTVGDRAYVVDQGANTDRTILAYDLPCSVTTQGGCDPVWEAPRPAGWEVYDPAVVVDGVVYVGSTDGYVSAYPSDCDPVCRPLWETSAAGYGPVQVAGGGGKVYAGGEGIYAFGLPEDGA
ncbi:MAG TPA: PQQ-binding-like beta-propeller repeat protein, partial [Actinomycetota bacterium]